MLMVPDTKEVAAMILIKNTQRTVSIDTKKMARDAQKILTLLDYADFDLGIWLTTEKTIREYNRQYRNKDKATDILSFPFYPALKAGERIMAQSDEEKNLGDLIIAPSYVQKDAVRYDMSFEQRMPVLLVHGICHLLGYDHIEDEDFAVMKKQEEWLLTHLP